MSKPAPTSNKNSDREQQNRVIAQNKRGMQKYVVQETIEAGVVLSGSEVKSLRAGQANLEGAYALLRGNELFLCQMHIAPYEKAGYAGHEPKQDRKLLLHRAEIEKLRGRLTQKGETLVPIRCYFTKGKVKVLLGLCRARLAGDKREDIKRELDRKEAREAMR